MPRERRSFTREYKLEAVRLVTEGGRPVSQVARARGTPGFAAALEAAARSGRCRGPASGRESRG